MVSAQYDVVYFIIEKTYEIGLVDITDGNQGTD